MTAIIDYHLKWIVRSLRSENWLIFLYYFTILYIHKMILKCALRFPQEKENDNFDWYGKKKIIYYHTRKIHASIIYLKL